MKIPKRIAQALINSLKGGVVPRVGLPYVTVGRKDEIDALLRDVDIIADGCHWRYADGTMDDASIDAPEEVADILASASGVLGVDALALVCEAREAANLCAMQEVG